MRLDSHLDDLFGCPLSFDKSYDDPGWFPPRQSVSGLDTQNLTALSLL